MPPKKTKIISRIVRNSELGRPEDRLSIRNVRPAYERVLSQPLQRLQEMQAQAAGKITPAQQAQMEALAQAELLERK